MSHGKKAQSILEFSTVITLVMAGAILMGPYLIRSINALLKNYDIATEEAIKGPLKKPGSDEFIPPEYVCGDEICVGGIEDNPDSEDYCCEDCDWCGINAEGEASPTCCHELDEDDRTSLSWCPEDCCSSNCVIDRVCDAACGEDKYTCCADNCWEADDGLCCVDNGEDSYNENTADIDPANPPWPPGTPAEPADQSDDCPLGCVVEWETCETSDDCCCGKCQQRSYGKVCVNPGRDTINPYHNWFDGCEYPFELNDDGTFKFCDVGVTNTCANDSYCCPPQICLKKNKLYSNQAYEECNATWVQEGPWPGMGDWRCENGQLVTSMANPHGGFSAKCGFPHDGEYGTCGNWVCDPGEDCENCIVDCWGVACNCGNDICELGETCVNCSKDCLGDGCGPGENCGNCPQDCNYGNIDYPCCGDGDCRSENAETCFTCPEDCTDCCGDGDCRSDHGEGCTTCPQDCGECVVHW